MICVTGKIGSGKSTVSKIVAEITGYEVIDVDKVGHEILESNDVKSEIRKVFSNEVFEGDKIDRKKLARIVFKNREKLKDLERILHPRMQKKVIEMVKGKDAVVDCALLERMDLLKICDFIITVISKYENSRIRKPHLSDEDFKSIWENQNDIRMIGIVIENDGTFEDLKRKVKDVMEMIT